VFGLLLFSFLSTSKRDKFKEIMDGTQGPGFPLDELDAATWALYKDDKWTPMQQISAISHVDGGKDKTMVGLDFARSNLLLGDRENADCGKCVDNFEFHHPRPKNCCCLLKGKIF